MKGRIAGPSAPTPRQSAITQRPSRSWKSSNRKVVTSPLRRPQPDEKRQQSTIASAAESVSAFRAQQLLAFFRSQPVSDTYSQPSNTLHATYACRGVRAEEPAIRRFICQPAYRRQSQVDRRRSIWVLFGGNPASVDRRRVEGGP